jgi:hypothetical protein
LQHFAYDPQHNIFKINKSISARSKICMKLRAICSKQLLCNQYAVRSNATRAPSFRNSFTPFTFSLKHSVARSTACAARREPQLGNRQGRCPGVFATAGAVHYK